MSDERWLRVKALFQAAVERPAEERDAFLAPAPGDVTRLTTSPNIHHATSVTPDGRWLVFRETAPTTGPDVMQLRLAGTQAITPLVQTPAGERNGEASPDGRWLANQADDSGRFNIYVRPFPDVSSGYWQCQWTAAPNQNGRTYEIAPDGKRFLMIKAGGADETAVAASLVVVQNWREELKRLVPTPSRV